MSVAAGQRHTLVLSKDGNVYSFGDGTVGQLGHGNTYIYVFIPLAIGAW